MTILDPLNMSDAETSVAVANTPIFLARRLRENPALQRAHALFGADKLLRALETIADREPRSITDATEVYFYLVSLSFDNDLKYLRRASELPVKHVKWFSEVAQYLLKSVRPISVTSVQARATVSPTIIGDSSVSNSRPSIIRI